tara:strand:+ start:12627 stop:13130 length:504 start_codon:yes stop_codon:yes gene_type:complete
MVEANEPETVELDENGEPKRNFRRVLEERAETAEARASELETQLAQLQRTEAFRAAGIDPADTRQSYFVKGYDGEIDAESIRTAAEEAGFLGGSQVASEPALQPTPYAGEAVTIHQEMMAQQRVADAGVQGQPVAQPGLNDRIYATKSEDELMALMRSEGYEFNVQG